MASSFRSNCRPARSSLSQLFHRQEQQPLCASFLLLGSLHVNRPMSQGFCRRLLSALLFCLCMDISGLAWGTDESQLKDAFSSFGEVTEASIVMDRETGESRGFGFVSFASPSDADTAIKTMNGRDLHGKTLRVNFAFEKSRIGGYGGAGGSSYGGGDGHGGRSGGYGGGGGGYGGYNDGGSAGGFSGGGGYGGGGGGYGGYSDGGSTGG